MSEDRKILEAEFHNNREKDEQTMSREEFEKKYPNKKLYSVTNLSHAYIDTIIKNWKGKKVLDYCCGAGGTSVKLAQFGCDVTGIDISDEEINVARAAAIRGGYQNIANLLLEMQNTQSSMMKVLIA